MGDAGLRQLQKELRDSEKAENRDRLQSASRVGPGVARALLADLPELGALGRRQIHPAHRSREAAKLAFIALPGSLTILNAMVREGTTWQQATR